MAQVNLEAVIKLKDEATKGLQNFSKSVKSAGLDVDKVLGAATVAATAAIGGLTAIAIKSVGEFRAQQDAESRLAAAIQNVTGATDKNIDALLKQANAFQFTTRFADEQIVSGQALLTTIGLTQQEVEKLTPSMLDLAERMRTVDGGTMSLESASALLGKAVSGNLGILSRYGINLSETQQKQLENMTTQERAIEIAGIMQEKFGGLAEAAGQTLSGQMDILSHVTSEFFETVGAGIANELSPYISKLIENREALAGLATKTSEVMATVIEWLIQAGTWIAKTTTTVSQFIKEHQEAIKWLGIFVGILGSLVLIAAIVIKAVAVIGAVVAAVATPVGAVVAILAVLITALAWVATHWDLVKQKVSQFGQTMLDVAKVVFKPWIDSFNMLVSLVQKVIGLFQSNTFAKVGDFIRGIGGALRIPGFAVGGTVPGAPGEPRLILAHGGEQVIPYGSAGGSSVNITMTGPVSMNSDQDVRRLAQLIANQITLANQGAY